MPTAVHPSLVEWLVSLPNIPPESVWPVKVRIIRSSRTVYEFEGARYIQHRENEPDTPRIYLLGDWNALHRKLRGQVCFDDLTGRVWYVACHSAEVIKPEFEEFHPFGQMFMLMPWTCPDPIDKWERHTHYRIEFIRR
jgi:hypothetical protein